MRGYSRRAAIALFILLAGLLPTAALAMSQADEIKLGRKALAELRPIGFVHEPALTEVGSALAQVVERKNLPWSFYVLEDTKGLNAFALPGGFVFITRRYYEMLNGDELAFVVGHEVAHIEKRHFEQTMKRARQAQLYDLLAGIVIGVSKAGRGWGTVADAGATAYYTKYSRKLEREADFIGYRLAQQAGFDAEAAVSALSKLGKDQKDPLFGTLFSTHPLLSSREDRLEAMKNETPPAVPRRTVKKTADPKWKPPTLSRDELKTRPGLAVRVVGEDGARWDSSWRPDLRMLISREIELAGRYDIRAEDKADGRGEPKLSDLRELRAGQLLVITVHQFQEETLKSNGDYGNEVRAVLALSPRLIDTATGAVTQLEEIKLARDDTEMLPTDKQRLFPDMLISRLANAAAKLIAQRISSTTPTAAVTPR